MYNTVNLASKVPYDLLPEYQLTGKTEVDAVHIIKHLVRKIRYLEAQVNDLSRWVASAYEDPEQLLYIKMQGLPPPTPEAVKATVIERIADGKVNVQPIYQQ